jgi:predicted CXXCH cytochrome family protein
VDKSLTTVDDINLTIHNATGLGRVNLIYLNNSQINGSISSTSYVCSQCHYPGHPNRTSVIDQFANAGFEAPQNNTYNVSTDPSYFYNHSDYLTTAGYGDSICNQCHGSLLSSSANMTEFAHNVGIGSLGNQSCISCHDVSKADNVRKINFTAFKASVHANLNSNATNTTYIEDPVVKACWACHQSDGSAPANMGDRYRTPRTCFDCHNTTGTPFQNVSNAPRVSEHFTNGSDIKAGYNQTSIVLSCIECHELEEMLVPGRNDPDNGSSVSDVDQDGDKGGNQSFYHYGRNRSSDLRLTRSSSGCGDNSPSTTNCSEWNRFPAAGITYTYTNCSYCHQDSDTAFTVAMNDSAGHASMSNHTNDSLGPYCTDCHIVYDGENTTFRLHDQQLVKPSRSYTTALDGDGMLNSTFCMTCHNQKEVHALDELTGELDGDTLECAACHANVSNYTSGFGEKQIHGIRYLNDSGVYSSEWLRSSAANCTTCHQGSQISEVWINSTYCRGLLRSVEES